MEKRINLHSGWNLLYKDSIYPAMVPGDITLDLFRAGVIKDPYYGTNHQDNTWVIGENFEYTNEFEVPEEIRACEEVLLSFDSIDTFALVSLNGTLLGYCDNMFRKYTYNIGPLLTAGKNHLSVKMLSTTRKMDAIDDRGFFGAFNVKRLFIRKAQCHFGWDWAPDMPGYGICGDVTVEGVSAKRMDSVFYKAHNNGTVTFFVDLNYYIAFGNQVNEDCRNDVLRYTLAKDPDAPISKKDALVIETKVTGKKNFVNFFVPEPQLWWPNGYGEHPLYAYSVELLRDGKVIDFRQGNLAFREVKLSQNPINRERMGYTISINGVDIFVKGSNWVPAECFIGCIDDEKYDILTTQAVQSNMNMLRVWGGGIYEKDIFYDLCDQKGLMVWQDLMFACADIPEDDAEFVENCKHEIQYQIKRLRNHPSIVYWCGGNEKTGSCGLLICHGDYFVDVFLRGLVLDLDDTRPYSRQSPVSWTDIGNDMTSGESHAGSFETSLSAGVLTYRDNVSKTLVPFISECAIMGPGSLESLKKFMPEDKLWPMNKVWDDRLMDNPYASVLMTFARRQEHYASSLYGANKNVEDFIAKGMTVHAETMRAEIEYARTNKGICWGFMNWMYSDIWPSATWSVVDYYTEPKQVYYQMKRSYEPVLVTFVQNHEKLLVLSVVNDTVSELHRTFLYGQKTLDGKVLWQKNMDVYVPANGVAQIPVVEDIGAENTYLFAQCAEDPAMKTVFSYSMWANCIFESDYTYTTEKCGNKLKVTVTANAFAKGVTLRFPENYKYSYSDNYIDLEAGESRMVEVTCREAFDEKDLTVTDFARETK